MRSQVVVTITSSTTSSKIKRREMEVGTLLKKRLRSQRSEKALIAIFGYVYNVEAEKQKLISRIMEALELC